MATMKANKRGFTLLDTLIALVVIIFCIHLFSMCIRYIAKNDARVYIRSDKNAIVQLQLLYALSYEHEIVDNALQMQYLGNSIHFVFYNNKLIRQDGYQVFLQDIESMNFIEQDACIYVQYERENQIYEKIIGCK